MSNKLRKAIHKACHLLEIGLVDDSYSMIDDDETANIAAGRIREAQSIIATAALEVDPDEANLRCLESSVKNLIACLCRHDGSVLRGSIPTTGTISGDLYAVIAATIDRVIGHNARPGTDDTLSDLQRRYPLPKPIDAAQAGSDGSRELPTVPCEVSDGGGGAERGGVCGSADVEPPVTTAEQFEADLLRIINAAKERNTYTADMVRAMMLHCHSAVGFDALLEQARSTTRRNILAAMEGGVMPPPGLPQQDVAVAVAVLRQAVKDEDEAERNVQELERQLLDVSRKLAAADYALKGREDELLGAIKGRDSRIGRLEAQINKLARFVAFSVIE